MPNTALYPMSALEDLVSQDRGHTEAWTVHGLVKDLNARIIDDDGKSIQPLVAEAALSLMLLRKDFVNKKHRSAPKRLS
jgi:hypothetical protein